MIRGRKTISQALAIAIMLSTATVNANALEPRADVSSTILAGANRYETAVKVSENGWSSATNAVIINGDKGLVDALTATPYASLKNAPILVTEKDKLTTATKNRLTKLGVKNVDIVGGEAVVSLAVENELKAMGLTVNRIKGNDRYETAVAVANEIHKISSVTKVAVVNGATGLPDAVSIAAPAADNKMPILLSDPNNGLEASKAFMNGKNITKSYVVGQTSAVSDSIMNTLPGTKTRLGGSDRHDTNAKVIKEFYTSTSLDNIYVAKSGYVKNNEELVDALAVGVLAAKNDDPVLIVGKTLDNAQETLLKEKKFTKITKVGNGIPSASIQGIKDTQKDPEAKVTKVTLVDYKTIKITGTELNRLTSSSITMSGNTVESYTANSNGTEATVVFKNAFKDGTNTVTVKSNLGNSTNHTFTYTATVSTVEATTSEIGTSGIQYLEFTVNGQKRSLEELKSLGYTVEFKSTQDIFYVSATSASKTSSTGKLRTKITAPALTPFTKDDTFTYEVSITKDNKTIKSSLKAVKVVDKSNEYKEVKSFDLVLSNGVKLSSNKMVINDTAEIKDLKLKNNNDADVDLVTATNQSAITVTSSKPEVIKVDNTGTNKNKLMALSSGTSEITVTAGSVSKTITVTVVTEARKFSKVELASSTANVTTGSTITTNITVKDQYNDPLPNYRLVPEDTKVLNAKGERIADVSGSITSTDIEGKTSVELVTNTNVGSGNLVFKNGTTILATLRVNVVNNTGANTWKLETSATDTKLDMYTPVGGTADNSLTLNLKGYMNNSYLVGKETSITNHTGNTAIPTNGVYVKTSDSQIANIASTSNGDIVVNAGTKAGTATIKAYKNGREVASTTITVSNSKPKLTAIKTNSIDTLKTADTYEIVKNLIDLTEISSGKYIAGGLTVTGTAEEIRLGNDGSKPVLYVDYDGNGSYTSSSSDVLIANIDISTDFGVTPDASGNGNVTLAAGNKGNIIVRIFNGDVNPLKVIVINVDVPTI